MTRFKYFVLLLPVLLAASVSAIEDPCCNVTAIRPDGVVTARVNSSGQQFQFAVKDPALLRSLKVGQGVYANFGAKQVSLDGKTACCGIVAVSGQAAQPTLPAIGVAARGAPSSIPTFVNASGGDGIDAANELMALPWRGLAAQYTAQGQQSVISSLEGKPIASGSTDLPGNSRLSFDLTLEHVASAINISASPGFRYASLTGAAGQKPGFVFQAPLNGYWSFGFGGDIRGRIEAYGQKLFDGSTRFVFDVFKLKLTAAAVVDSARLDRPTLVEGYVNPELVLDIQGYQVPFDAVAKLEAGTLILPARVTGLGFDFGNLAAKLDADITLTIYPQMEQETVGAAVGGPVIGTVETRLSAAVQTATLALSGNLRVRVKDPLGQSHDANIPMKLSAPITIPTSRAFNQALLALHPPIPQSYPQVDGPVGNPTADFSRLAATAAQFESAISPRHMPFGAILMIDRRPQPEAGRAVTAGQFNLPLPKETYGRLSDSAVWTGHYLAAEAFRYAATNNPDALARIQQVVAGIQQLFWVTGDAAVVNGKAYPVGRSGLLARSALPASNPIGWWEGMPPRNDDGSVPCYYVRPEGGWRSGTRTFATYGDAVGSAGAASPVLGAVRGSTPEPVGVVWYGVGCGKIGENPISRDQYDGIMMGLAYAYALVPDEKVRTPIRAMVNAALRAVVQNDQWSLKLPPDGAISTTWFGDLDMQLDFLRIGATVDPAQWLSVYQHFKAASALTWLPGWFSTFDPISGYYKFNLTQGVFGPVLLLEDDLQARRNYMNAYQITRAATEKHRNAYFDLVRILVELPKDRQPVAAAVGTEVTTLLTEWLERLTRVAAPSGFPTNGIPDANAMVQSWLTSVQPYRTLAGGTPFLTKYPFPLQQRAGDSDFVWEANPFRTALHAGAGDTCGVAVGVRPTSIQLEQCASAAWREGAGLDYLLPYWLATYLGLLPK